MSRSLVRKAMVVVASRRPPLWNVKAGGRFQAGFTGPNARAKAIAYAEENYCEFEVLDSHRRATERRVPVIAEPR
jgi:hypothetical protein